MPLAVQQHPHLPIELVDDIVAYLRPEESQWENTRWADVLDAERGVGSLHACSLVCHQWRAVALPHLFHSVTYSFRREDSFEEALIVAPNPKSGVRYKTLSMLCDFLQSDPDAGNWVRRLKLAYSPLDCTQDVEFGEHPKPDAAGQIDACLFERLLHLCPRLEVLHLHGVLLRQVNGPTFFRPRPLKCLKLSPFSDPLRINRDRDMLGDLAVAPLAFFSSVEKLRVSQFVLLWALTQGMAFPSLKVESLSLEGSGVGLGLFVDALLQSPSANTIRTLTMDSLQELRYLRYSSVPKLQSLLDVVGPNLDMVTCKGIEHEPLLFPITPDLSACAQLRRLYLGIQLKKAQMAVRTVCTKALDVLRSVPMTAPLEHLELQLVFRNIAELGRMPGETQSMDEELSEFIASHHVLRTVVVTYVVEGRLRLPEAISYEVAVQKLLPKLHERRQLCMVVSRG